VPEFESPPEDATDHQVAEGIRDGKYASPQKVGDFWLFDLRVTGTGAAYRDSLDEWAFRDPKLWLTDEFVERAASLPVIWGHPERSGLNSEEYRERSIGNMVLAYIKGDEVWGVGKIFDADAALAMQTTHRSTSPGVTPPKGSTPVELNDGTKVLAEGLPLILDHLAVCEAGVWDKDGPPDGIRLDAALKGPTVADEDLEAVKKERDDAKAKLDAFEKADAARKDAEEKEKADKAKKDESDKEAIEAAEKEKADSAKRDSRKDRHSKHDGDIMDCARCDSEEETEREDKAKKDAAPKTPVDADRGNELHDSKFAAMQAEIDRLKAANRPLTMAERDEIAKAFHRADKAYQSLGDQTPQAIPGESPIAYRRRLANGLRAYTQSWKTYAFHDSQQSQDFRLVEDAIYSEAAAFAKTPQSDGKRVTREVVTYPHGKTRTEFIGDSRDFFAPFMHPRKFAVTKINRPNLGNVYGE